MREQAAARAPVNTPRTYLLVALGGMVGALSRHGVTVAVVNIWGHAALGTFVANISGAFLLGFVSALTAERIAIPANLQRAITVGILGSYTTMSVLSYQTFELLEDGNVLAAGLNAGGSLLFGILAAAAGVKLGRR